MHNPVLRLFFFFLALTSVVGAIIHVKELPNTLEIRSEDPPNDLHEPVLPRGRSRGSRPSRAKPPQRPKPKPKPKPKTKTKTKPTPTASRSSKPTKTDSVNTKSSTAAPSVRPQPPPKIPYPNVAFDTCDVFVDCSKDDKDFQVSVGARSEPTKADSALVKRARTFPVKVGATQITIRALDYPSSSELYTKGSEDALTVHTLGFKDSRLGTTSVIDTHRIPTEYSLFYTEHIVELQSVGMFIEYAIEQQQGLDTFFLNNWNKEFPQQTINDRKFKPAITFGKGRRSLNALVFEALGSNLNRKDFVLCDREINAYKESLWSEENPMEAGKPTSKFEKLVNAANLGQVASNEYLSAIRTTIAVFNYMNAATVRANLRDSMNNVKIELQNVKALTTEITDLASMWETFLRQQMRKMETYGKQWLSARIAHADTELVKTTKKYQGMNADLKKKENSADWNRAQNRKRSSLDSHLKTEKAAMLTAGHKVTALEEERDGLVRQIQKAKGAAKKPLEDKKDDVKEELRVAKLDLEAKKRSVRATQRNILELNSVGVQQVLQDLQEDEQTLARYRSLVSGLRMPTI